MIGARWCRLSITLLTGSLVFGCDRSDPLQPELRAAGSSGSPTAAPSGTSAVAVSERRIDVSWQDNSTNEDGFEIHRSTSGPAGTFTPHRQTGAGVTSYSDAGLPHSTQYCYQVRAFRFVGRKTSYSALSPTACATTPLPPPPAAPVALDATPLTSTAINVFWTDSSANEDGFRVERSSDGGASWIVAGTTTAFTYSAVPGSYGQLTDSGRTSEQQVCYRAIAFNAGGDSGPSNTDCTAPPAAPTNVTAVFDPLTGLVVLTWTDNSAVEDGYAVSACCDRVLLPANTTRYEFFWDFYAEEFFVVATRDGGYSDWTFVAVPAVP